LDNEGNIRIIVPILRADYGLLRIIGSPQPLSEVCALLSANKQSVSSSDLSYLFLLISVTELP